MLKNNVIDSMNVMDIRHVVIVMCIISLPFTNPFLWPDGMGKYSVH